MSIEAGLTRDDYIAKSGGTTQNADRKRIYVVRANGDVVSGDRSGWFRRTQAVEMQPGRHHRRAARHRAGARAARCGRRLPPSFITSPSATSWYIRTYDASFTLLAWPL